MRYPLRPFWVIGLTWFGVCLAGAWLSVAWLWVSTVVTGALFLTAWCIPWLRQFRTLLLILIAAAIAFCAMIAHEPPTYAEQTVTLRAKVVEVEPVPVLTVQEGDLDKGMRLYLWQEPIDVALKKYDVVEAEFLLQPLVVDGYEAIVAKSEGVLYAVLPTDTTGETWTVTAGEPTLIERFTEWRIGMALEWQSQLDGDVGAVVTGICLGVDARLSGEAVSAFRVGGVSHLFSVSGLHLSVLTGAFLWLLRRLHVPRRVGAVVTMVAVALFCLLMGGEPSVVRAGVLCLIVCGGLCLRREADACNSLGLALFLLLVVNPYAAYDIGLLLSFSATCGLLFLAPFLRKWLLRAPWTNGVWDAVASAVSVTVSAMVATLPIVILFFGRLSLVGVVANVVLMLPASALLIFGWIALLPLLLGWSVLYYPLLFLIGWLSKALLWVVKGLAALPLSSVSVGRDYVAIGLVGAVVLVGLGYVLLRRRGAYIALGCSIVILCVGGVIDAALQQGRITVRCFETGGDMAAYVTYDDHTVLVIAPTETETLYDVAHSLSQEEIVSVEAVFLPSGENREIAYCPTVLGDSAAGAMFYRPSKTAVSLEVGEAVWHEQGLYLTVGDVRIAFYDTTDADVSVTASGMTVHENGVSYAIVAQDDYRPRIYIKNGRLRIK